METIKIKGVLKEIFKQKEGVSKSGKEWRKQDFLIENKNKFNNEILITIFGEVKQEQRAFFEVGRHVEVEATVSSNEYKGRYYTNITFLNIKHHEN